MSVPARLRAAAGLGYGSLLLLLLWSRNLSPWMAAAAAVALGGSTVLLVSGPVRSRLRTPLPVALALLGLALLAAAASTIRLEAAARNWEEVTSTRTTALTSRLEARLGGAVRRADAAARLTAELPAGRFSSLARVRDRTGVDALAVLAPNGEPETWAGTHRGRLPPDVVALDSGTVYPGGSLFGYLYRVSPAEGGRRAVAAVLLQAGPPFRGGTGSLAERFEGITGEVVRFAPPGQTAGDLSVEVDGAPVLDVRFQPLSQGEWRGRVAKTGRRVVFILGLVALGLLVSAWHRTLDTGVAFPWGGAEGAEGTEAGQRDRGAGAAAVSLAALSLTLMVAPLGQTLGVERLFSPALFVLPIPGDIVLEGLLVVVLPLAAFVATVRPGEIRPGDLWLRLAIGGALVGGGFTIVSGILAASAGPPLLTRGGPLWYLLQPTAVLLLAILTVLLMPRSDVADDRGSRLLFGVAGLVLSTALALGLAVSWQPTDPVPTPLLLAWSVPFVLAARALAGYGGRGDRLIRWLMAGWLASTAVIPHVWLTSQEAKLAEAEAEVASFGVRGDPFLNYLLVRFGDELMDASERGEQRVDLLYEAWVASGLAGEPYPLEVAMWDSTFSRLAHLPLGIEVDPAGAAATDLRALARRAVEDRQVRNEPAEGTGISRMLAIPLRAGRVVTVAVAPRATHGPMSALAPFVADETYRTTSLELIPTPPSPSLREGEISWQRSEVGWQSETLVREGRQLYHAHLEVRLPPAGVRLARGVLVVTGNLLLLTLLWFLGRLARGDPPVPPGGWLGWFGGFRARLIVALFAFFLLPTAVFGWVAYQALAGEVTRAARQVAERAVVQSASLLPEVGLLEASRRIGEDLLYFRDGALAGSSFPEAAELGIYGAWLPPGVHTRIASGEALEATEMGELAGRAYLVAYRRLGTPAEVVGIPVWLAARDVAVRQREFADLVLFGTLVGAILSLALSVAVGRALARPIGELRRAASAVGRGRLRVRLPDQRPDEFGELFASFNQMVRRLRRARAQEVRTARILAWGEVARQVAHEIKNPLTPIKLSVQHLRRAYRDRREDFEPVLEKNVEQILIEIERLTEIAKVFSRYGAPEEAAGATEAVDVARIAADVLTLYRAPDRAVRYELSVECDDCLARARAAELREVLVNLLENARAAVADTGRVEVRVTTAGPRVLLAVRDDGEGIDPEQLPRIFEPHFSTRSSGTGLGLAIVRRLAESWGGQITAESEPGEGTTVRLEMWRYPAPDLEESDAG